MSRINLKDIATGAAKKVDKKKIKEETLTLKLEIEELQNLLYAESKHALLIILQGMDASGKDGVLKHVFDTVNPLGCRAIPFKTPSELEMKHDFLWRVHKEVPEKGMIQIFNRSYYEDVLIQRVHKWIDEKTVKERFKHINNFEQLLTDNGVTILKFYLHVSKDEQEKRLDERMNDRTKMWKYNEADLKERKFWKDYMNAYEDVFANCNQYAKWHIIPADDNWYKEYLIAKKLVETMKDLKMQFPGFKPAK